jgi:hypothetical protein
MLAVLFLCFAYSFLIEADVLRSLAEVFRFGKCPPELVECPPELVRYPPEIVECPPEFVGCPL